MVRDGAPVTGVEVVVSVTGSDQIVAATTDESGAFVVQLEVEAGSEVHVDATGQTSRSEPDAANCVHLETPTGSLTFTIQELPPAAVEVTLDEVLTGLVCGPTATPGLTTPSTDGDASAPGTSSGGGTLLVLGVLALLTGGTLALARRWR